MNHNKPIEHSDPMVPPTFESPVFEAEDEDGDDIPDEITRTRGESHSASPGVIELFNLGTEDNAGPANREAS